MTWRRYLWFGLLAALGWGLYLFVPPKPRWTLPEHEVPVKVNATRMVSIVLDESKKESQQVYSAKGLATYKAGLLRLRDLKTGQVLASASGPKEDGWLLWKFSEDLRYCFFERGDETAFAVHDFETGIHWKLTEVHPPDLSPRGTLVGVITKDDYRLLESATGRLVAQFPSGYGLEHFAPDDSMAFLLGSEKGDDNPEFRWLRWERDGATLSKGPFPSFGDFHQFSPDRRTAAFRVNDPNRLLIWDVIHGRSLYSLPLPSLENVDYRFSPDGAMLAVWTELGDTIDLLEIPDGKKTTLKTNSKIGECLFSPDGKMLVYFDDNEPHAIVGIEIPELQERWRRTTNADRICTLSWLETKENRLMTRYFDGGGFGGGDPRGVLVLHGETGRELFRRPTGELSADNRVLIHSDRDPGHVRPARYADTVLRWLPWFKDIQFFYLTVEDIDSGNEVFRRAYAHPAIQEPPWLHWPYCDRTTLVLMCRGRETEIWDLPPARRWLWILGPPAALVVLSWLWRMRRRKQSPGTSPTKSSPPASPQAV